MSGSKTTSGLKNGDPGKAFKGKIGRVIPESTPWWPEPTAAPKGAPNVLIIYLDDLGFSDLGCFGSEIETPNIDALAAGGLRFMNYTTVPMCSPARAALLTGKNPHSVGCGWIAHANPGFPGYYSEISNDAPTLAEILGENGYSTMMVGKWHNTWHHNVHEAADKNSWPTQRGFERFYGFLDAETNYFCPDKIYEGNVLKDMDTYAEDYFATDDWTSKAISWMKEHNSSEPHRPFFMYMAFNAPHMPIHAKAQDSGKYAGRYAAGWDAFRQSRHAKQLATGLVDERYALAPMPPGVPAWADLPAEKQALFAKYMELYAGLVDNIDQNVGRVMAFLRAAGLDQNTLIVLSSDNGASAVGGLEGTPNFIDQREGVPPNHAAAKAMAEDGRLGSHESMTAYPTGWAQVSNAPFYFFKRTPMNGGIRVPLIVHWPKGLGEPGAVRKDWVHVTDITPTILDVIGLAHPDAIKGFEARKPDGVSFKPMLQAAAPSARAEQYYELEANRAYIAGDWKIASLQPRGGKIETLDNWMLFNLKDDPTECHNLASQHPEIVQELMAKFDEVAFANYVYPLDNRDLARAITIPPFLKESVNTPRDFYPDTQTISKVIIGPLIADRNFRILSEFDWQPGQEGVIFAIGEIFVGLSLYVMNDRLQFTYHRWMSPIEMPEAVMTPGHQSVVVEFEALGKRRSRARLVINGIEVVAMTDMSPSIIGVHYEGIDIGLDRRQRTISKYAGRGSFAYTGSIERVRVEPGDQAPDSLFNRLESELTKMRD
ncbi:MAG: arylsulfatase [Hyphomicrobiales bacterium]|nr:arylsulfatase [Hyphomicrobiales bacterium]MDE2115167.1 arylsulfatase [Hyphomicrobiales bacterium]